VKVAQEGQVAFDLHAPSHDGGEAVELAGDHIAVDRIARRDHDPWRIVHSLERGVAARSGVVDDEVACRQGIGRGVGVVLE